MGRRPSRSRPYGALLAVLLAVVMAVGLAPTAAAHPRVDHLAGRALGGLWSTVLSTPGDLDPTNTVPDNPFLAGACARYGGVVAPFQLGAAEISCTLRRGQPLFVVGQTFETSTLEASVADADEATLRAEALAQLPGKPVVRFDGRRLPLVKADSGLVTVPLPQPNVFASPDPSVDLVAVGWVTGLVPPPGRHTIDITLADGTVVPTTQIEVPRHRAR